MSAARSSKELPDNVALHPTALRHTDDALLEQRVKPLVSVALVTYNHGPYIARALDSIMEQRCDFDFEVVVGDDCSTDATRAIVEIYMRRYPGQVRLLHRETNLGSQRNVAETLKACEGEYIAYLDGDDYWTHPKKLQRQYNALFDNPEAPLVFHSSRMLYDHCKPGLLAPPKKGKATRFGVNEILKKNFIAAQSVMVRAEAAEWIPEWLFDHPDIPWDWPFFIECAKRGDLLYIDESMCAYRIHPQGLWSGQTAEVRLRAVREMLDEVEPDLPSNYRGALMKARLKLGLKQKLVHWLPRLPDWLQRVRQSFVGR